MLPIGTWVLICPRTGVPVPVAVVATTEVSLVNGGPLVLVALNKLLPFSSALFKGMCMGASSEHRSCWSL